MSSNHQREEVLQELLGGVWHTTSPKRFGQILNDGAILPNPDIDDSERWGTAIGSEGYSYVRKLGGVSLFDFRNFDHIEYGKRCPLSNWEEFVPYRSKWKAAVWIEIDVSFSPQTFISGKHLTERWNSEGAFRHRIMPFIEAAVTGEIPAKAFIRHFRINAS